MKVLVNRRIVHGPWGGGNNFVVALVEGLTKAGHEVVHSLEENIDCFFIVDPRPDDSCPGLAHFLQAKNEGKYQNKKIIQRINECDARKNTEHMDPMLLHCSKHIDKTIFVSEWMQNYFLNKGWQCKNYTYIHNGVDNKVFVPGHRQKGRLKSVVAHHWSNNIMKGFDAYEFLDYMAKKDLIEFTYIGRHRNTFKNTRCIEPCTGEVLAKKLQGHDIYISGSRFDPGPNHILEAISVGLPTYVHADGGGSVEFAGHDHTFSNLSELEELILSNNYTPNEYKPISWDQSIQTYIRSIEA